MGRFHLNVIQLVLIPIFKPLQIGQIEYFDKIIRNERP